MNRRSLFKMLFGAAAAPVAVIQARPRYTITYDPRPKCVTVLDWSKVHTVTVKYRSGKYVRDDELKRIVVADTERAIHEFHDMGRA